MEYTIQLTWDPEAYVWTAESSDIPGLTLESKSIDKLMERVRRAVPELLALNDITAKRGLCFRLERHERLFV